MANRVWVFDLDGTLMDTLDLYRKPLEKAFALIMEVLGDNSPTLSEIKLRHNILDRALIYKVNPLTGRLYYYTKQRFPTSLVEIYKLLCREAGIESDCAVERRLYKIGLEAFKRERYRRKIKPQVLPLVRFLTGQGDTLLILTKGDKGVQGDKKRTLKEAGLLKYFRDFLIAEDKKDSFFRSVTRQYPSESYYSVGDTYYDDIVPAIKHGYFGIYIPSPANWKEIGKLKKIERRRSKTRSRRYEGLMEIREKYGYL